jgi:hypothetical protein
LRPKDWRAPSWTWACVDSPIRYSDELHEKGLECELAFFAGKSIVTKTKDSLFGELKSADMTLRGKAIEVKLSSRMNRTVYTLDFPEEFESARTTTSFMLDFNMYPKDEWFIEAGDPLIILAIGVTGETGFGLALQRNNHDDDGSYMRVGKVTMKWKIMEQCLQTVEEEREFLIK